MMDRYATLRDGLIGAWCPSLGCTGRRLTDFSQSRCDATPLSAGSSGITWFVYPPGVVTPGFGTVATYFRSTDLPISGSIVNLSIAAWIRPSNTSQTRAIFALGSESTGQRRMMLQRGLQVEANGQFADIATSEKLLVAGQWAHACITYAGTSLSDVKIYINGISQSLAVSFSGTLAPFTNRKATLGANNNGGEPWSGSIDDARVYNRTLTEPEVALLASGRGVGLRPSRRRRAITVASTSHGFHINVGGTWKSATPWVKVNGVWKQATPKLNVGGVWK